MSDGDPKLTEYTYLHRSVVTAALPAVMAATRAGRYDALEAFKERRELADALPPLGIDVTTDLGASVLAGALTTCIFVCKTAEASGSDPSLVWRQYLSEV